MSKFNISILGRIQDLSYILSCNESEITSRNIRNIFFGDDNNYYHFTNEETDETDKSTWSVIANGKIVFHPNIMKVFMLKDASNKFVLISKEFLEGTYDDLVGVKNFKEHLQECTTFSNFDYENLFKIVVPEENFKGILQTMDLNITNPNDINNIGNRLLKGNSEEADFKINNL